MVSKALMMAIAAMAPLAAWAEMPATQPAPATRPATRPAPATQPTPLVLALIEQMGAGNFQSRMHAQKALVNMGPWVEPALKHAASESSSAEIRDRAAIAAMQIEQIIAAAPTFITLHAKNTPARDVLKQLSQQAGVRVLGWPDNVWNGRQPGGVAPITLDLDRAPFWTAIEALCKITHTHPQFVGQGQPSNVSLMQGDIGKWDQEGRFAFTPTMINHDSTVDLVNGGSGKNDSITLEMYVDPKIHSVDWDQPLLTVAEDEQGRSLLPPAGAVANYFFHPGFQPQWAIEMQAPLVFPARYGHRLARLEGTLTVRFPRELETLSIPDMAKAVGTATVGGNHKVDVLACSPSGKNGFTVHLTISRLAGAGPSVPGGIFQEFQTARVTDSTGQQLFPNGGGGGTDMQIDWQGTYISPGGQVKPPISLQWETIKRVESVTVPFKFKDLPLPPQ